MVGGSQRVAAVAAEHGLAPEQVERMLAAYWQQSGADSPVEHRVAVLGRYWGEFDAIHARQERGMPALWGLVQEHAGSVLRAKDDDRELPEGDVHERLLSPELRGDIMSLWGTAVLPRWPERLVTEPFPHVRLAEALGPALRFWHGAALTAWYICEGPYSRTDLDGLANYHHHELDALDALGCPIPGDLFSELRAAESRLGPEEYDEGDASEYEVGEGISLTVSMQVGRGKRAGFELLRDIITRHRRQWTERYFEQYLRAQWETNLRALAEAYHRHAADKGKAPTPKQFAKLAAPSANLWFGGDLTGVYGVLGLKAPPAPTRNRLMPDDVQAFAERVYERLSGESYDLPPTWKEDPVRRERHNQLFDLAVFAPEYVRVEEALGGPPELKEFGRAKFEHRSASLAPDTDEAWRFYGEAVHASLAEAERHPPEEVQAGPTTASPDSGVATTAAPTPEPEREQGFLGRALGRFRTR